MWLTDDGVGCLDVRLVASREQCDRISGETSRWDGLYSCTVTPRLGTRMAERSTSPSLPVTRLH